MGCIKRDILAMALDGLVLRRGAVAVVSADATSEDACGPRSDNALGNDLAATVGALLVLLLGNCAVATGGTVSSQFVHGGEECDEMVTLLITEDDELMTGMD